MKFPFQPDPPDPLRKLLAEKYETIAAKARETGQVEKADLDSVDALAKFCALAETAKPKKSNPILGTVVMLVTLASASFLLFSHVSATQIEAEAVLTSATFRVSQPVTIMGGWELKSLGISGFDELKLPAIEDQGPRTLAGGSQFRVQAMADDELPGTVNLAPIQLAKNTVVTLEPTDKGSYRLYLKLDKGAQLRLTASLRGAVRLDGLDEPTVSAKWRVPKRFEVTAASAPLNVDLEFRKEREGELGLSPLLPVDQLGLWQVEEFSDGAEGQTRVIPSILSGTLFFESLNGQERKLRENELLRLRGLKGMIRSVRLNPGNLSLRYEGEVQGLSSGSEPHLRNLMPSWLEFLKAQRPVELLWATAMYLFGIVMAGLKWLKVKV